MAAPVFNLSDMFSPTKLWEKLKAIITWANSTFLTSHQSIKTIANVTITGTGNVTLSDLGLDKVFHYKGVSQTAIADGDTTNPITLVGGATLTAETADVVLYDGKEFVWGESAWELFGADGIPVVTVASSTASQDLAPNTLYIFSSRATALTLTLGTPTSGIANEYHFFLVTDSTTAPTVTWPSGISWNGGSAPTIAADKTYEVSILNNVAAYFEI